MDTYNKLLEMTKEIIQFETGIRIIRWDLQTHIPPKGMKQRGEQLALMGKLLHRMSTDKERARLVTELEKKFDMLDDVQRREVEITRKKIDIDSKIPEDLVAAESKQRTVCTTAWKRGKETNNWKLFESEMATSLDILKKIAENMMDIVDADTSYDALMDYYEPRLSSQQLSRVFGDLRKRLIPLVRKFSERCKEIPSDITSRSVPIQIQKALVTDLAKVIGFDTTSENAVGLIAESEHAFTLGYYDDVRIAIHYTKDDVFKSVFSSLHETGHAIHNQNQNQDWMWMYLGQKCSTGIGESQSRFIENVIGKSPEFWEFYKPRFDKITKGKFDDVSTQELLKAINQVRPTKIRVMADELTYSLHIIIRFEIEYDLFNENISISEIPEIWKEKFENYLGVQVDNYSEGVLQDVHWAWGLWGYFPSYTLGDLYAAMLCETMSKSIPEWRNHLAEGNIASPVQWMIENVHKKSNRYDPADMIKKITGKSLTADPFIKYLDEKYSALFG